MLERPLLLLPCVHHTEELVVKRVKAAIARQGGRTSTSPTDLVVKLWQANFNTFREDIQGVLNSDTQLNSDTDQYNNINFRVFDWDQYEDQPAVLEAAQTALNWAREAKRTLQFSRGDYLYALNLLLFYLGAMVPLQIFTPAEVNSARFLQEGIMNLEVFLCWHIPGVSVMFRDFEEEIDDLAFFSAIYYLPYMLRAKFAQM